MQKKKQVKKQQRKQSDFFIWEQSGPGIRKLSGDLQNLYTWYKKKKRKKYEKTYKKY